MRKRNKTKQLNRVSSHRKAMMRNMVTSLFDHERIVSTRARCKVLRPYAEKLITRAKRNLDDGMKPEQILHNKREVMKHVRERDVVVKLFEDIAPRFKSRAGGYIRIIHLPERDKDSAEMSIIELVERKEKERKEKAPAKAKKAPAPTKGKGRGKDAPEAAAEKDKDKKDKKEGKWYWRFRKNKGDAPT